MHIIIFAVLLLSNLSSTVLSQAAVTGCKADLLAPNACFSMMTKGLCTDKNYIDYMKSRCSATCGYCCSDGTLSRKPFNQGCKDSGFCAAVDRLPLLVDVTIKKRCVDYYYDKTFKSSQPWVKYYCETTFEWCCMDKKTLADGQGNQGCPYKLCYNVYSDEYCLNKTMTNSTYCDATLTKYKCAWTCKNCKPQKPRDCGVHGCCWNGVPARRQDQKDCPVCRDTVSRRLCKMFDYACGPNGQYRLRSFMYLRCPRTCKVCVKKTRG